MPVSVGRWRSSSLKASTPPADAPTPTTGKPRAGRPSPGAATGSGDSDGGACFFVLEP